MLKNKKSEEMVEVTVASERAEAIGGVLIALFAAMMAISELVNGELEEEMMISHNKHVSYSSWYQSKSIKQSLMENQLEYLNILLKVEDIAPARERIVKEEIRKTDELIAKYESEKNEILLGSANIPEEKWAQDLDGEMGMIVGIKEWEKLAEEYDLATKKFDLGMLFFQISIVLGAVCIIIYDNPGLQRNFIRLMIVFGIIGIGMSAYGYLLAP